MYTLNCAIYSFFCICIYRHVGKGLDDNYCRNPNNDVRPWCYTMDKITTWEYCNISVCGPFTFLHLAFYKTYMLWDSSYVSRLVLL